MLPVVVNQVTDLKGDFTRIPNGVYVQYVQDYADQRTLRTASWETFWI